MNYPKPYLHLTAARKHLIGLEDPKSLLALAEINSAIGELQQEEDREKAKVQAGSKRVEEV